MAMIQEIQEYLLEYRDLPYGEFQSRSVPSVSQDMFIGVRTPILRAYAKELARREDIGEFLACLPHASFEENQLHAFVIALDKDYEHCIAEVDKFLPYVDNWATCDQMSPKVFKKHLPELFDEIVKWIGSDHTYTIRFGIKMLMEHYLEDAFDDKYPAMVAGVVSEEYYVNMMIAWYFATALAKQYEAVLPYMTEQRMGKWVHNKAIQKAIESYRITPEQKEYLRGLKV